MHQGHALCKYFTEPEVRAEGAEDGVCDHHDRNVDARYDQDLAPLNYQLILLLLHMLLVKTLEELDNDAADANQSCIQT